MTLRLFLHYVMTIVCISGDVISVNVSLEIELKKNIYKIYCLWPYIGNDIPLYD